MGNTHFLYIQKFGANRTEMENTKPTYFPHRENKLGEYFPKTQPNFQLKF